MSKKSKKVILKWKVNTKGLLNEVLTCKGSSILYIPLRIFMVLLAQVALRATELNDKKLNQLMMRLGLYDISNPESKEYDPNFVEKYISGDNATETVEKGR